MKYSNNSYIRESLKELKMIRRKKVFNVLKHVAVLALLTYIYHHYFNLSHLKSFIYSFLSVFLLGILILIFKFIKYVKQNKR